MNFAWYIFFRHTQTHTRHTHKHARTLVHTQGGREKAPAAFCRKAICSTEDFEMWGDGEQTRSFMFIDDCVEGSIRIMEGDYALPLNLGTEEMVSGSELSKVSDKTTQRAVSLARLLHRSIFAHVPCDETASELR